MKKNYSLITWNVAVFLIVISMFFRVNSVVLADAMSDFCAQNPDSQSCKTTVSTAVPTGNPIVNFLNNVINFLAKVGAALGVLLLIVAGFYFVTARGDNSKIEKARTMVLWVIIGIAVVVFAKVLIGLVANFAGGSSPSYSPGT